MTSYDEVRSALSTAVRTYQPDLNVYYATPRTLVPPAAIVKPQSHKTVSYLQAQSSGLAKWHFHVLLIIGLVNEQAAQKQAGDLISPYSPLIQALRKTQLPNGYATVVDAGLSEMTFSNGLYTYAQISVDVTA